MKRSCNYGSSHIGYDGEDLDIEELYESTLTSILDIEDDNEAQIDFSDQIISQDDKDEATSSNIKMSSIQVEQLLDEAEMIME